MDKFAVLLSVFIVLFGIILYYVMKPRVIVQEVPVYTPVYEPRIDWIPWGWGWGSNNTSGSVVIHRPQPHFPFHRPHHFGPRPSPPPSPRPSPPRPSPPVGHTGPSMHHTP